MLLLQSQRIILAKVVSGKGSGFHFNKTIFVECSANKIAPGRLSFGMGSPVGRFINGSFS
jgi:hypothetical protein